MAPVLHAQSVETVRFRALMSSSHETTATTIGVQAMGAATVEFILKKDSAGALQSAMVDFRIDHYVGQAETLVNMHIHRGAEGVAGPVVVGAGFGAPVATGPGSGTLFRAVQLTDPTALAVVTEILGNPAGFYVNIHSQSFPGGIMRGQLEPVVDPISILKPLVDNLSGRLDLVGQVVRTIALRIGINPADLPQF